MKTRAPAPWTRMRQVFVCLSLLCAVAACLASEPAAAQPSPAPAPTQVVAGLTGPWRFHVGDDPRWADPNFDDSAWPQVSFDKPLTEQGIDTYSGYAWYRLRLSPQELAQDGIPPGASPFQMLVSVRSVGQLAAYVNGSEAGHTKGMTGAPEMYQSPPLLVQVTPTADGNVVLAVRSWADAQIGLGLLGNVELGTREAIADRLEQATARQWDRHALAPILVSFLFFCVAALAATLYMAQRNHAEYLWLALLCLSVAAGAAAEACWALALIPLSFFNVSNACTGWLFIVTTLEFVLRFTASNQGKVVRGLQIATLFLPITAFLNLEQSFRYVALVAEIAFCSLVILMLFRAWRRGRPESGVMLLPFLLAATADSSDEVLNFAAEKHWISSSFATHHYRFGPVEYHTGTVAYLVFLGSLIAVILYRFIRVSQEEQRSTAEIEAARSVQALLIPTQLPSNRRFVLESAYLPASGVGGDFFQVLPIQDGSMLIVVGDVSGKGLQAAMNASTLVGALRNELAHEPATVLAHLNQVLLGSPAAGISNSVAGFATCLCARIYPSGQMTIANAGHLSPYLDGREMELAACLPLGIIPNVEYEQSTFQLSPGDRLTFLSDGVVEATDAKGELFGFERTQQVSHEPARYIAQVAQKFGQNDDITVVSLYFVPA